jgi:hypothetical protein
MVKIQFSLNKANTPNSLSLRLLQAYPKDKNARVWHRQYHCSGIQRCQLSHPDIITPCEQYNRIDPEIFREVRKKAAVPILQTVRQEIEANTRVYDLIEFI